MHWRTVLNYMYVALKQQLQRKSRTMTVIVEQIVCVINTTKINLEITLLAEI